MKILLFGGTTEGRLLARKLTEQGHDVAVSVATPVGEEGLEGLTVRTGRLEAGEIAALLDGFDLCVDAAHPYARLLHKNLQTAAERAGVPLRRVSRPESETVNCVVVESAEEAADCLQRTEGPVLLTTGAKELGAFRELDPARLYARILPTHESLAACQEIGLPHRNILALWGPFSEELNAAMFRQYGIRWLVTKDSGRAGGFEEKISAAQRCGVGVILIRRPEDRGITVEELLMELEKGESLCSR